jgi:hypothetical protein
MKKFAMLFTVATVFAISCNNEAPATEAGEETATEVVEEVAPVMDSTVVAVDSTVAAPATK